MLANASGWLTGNDRDRQGGDGKAAAVWIVNLVCPRPQSMPWVAWQQQIRVPYRMPNLLSPPWILLCMTRRKPELSLFLVPK